MLSLDDALIDRPQGQRRCLGLHQPAALPGPCLRGRYRQALCGVVAIDPCPLAIDDDLFLAALGMEQLRELLWRDPAPQALCVALWFPDVDRRMQRAQR